MRKYCCKLNRLVTITLFLCGCGIQDAKYVDYSDEGKDDEPLTQCEQEALDNFSVNIQPVIDQTCTAGGCHSITPPTTLYKKGSPADNAKELFEYSGGDAQKLFDKYNSPTHGGTALGEKLPLAILNTWIELRNSCK